MSFWTAFGRFWLLFGHVFPVLFWGETKKSFPLLNTFGLMKEHVPMGLVPYHLFVFVNSFCFKQPTQILTYKSAEFVGTSETWNSRAMHGVTDVWHMGGLAGMK